MISPSEQEQFRAYLTEEELAENTISAYMYAVRIFFSSYPEVTKQNVIAWKEEMKKKFRPQTVNLRLRGIIQYAEFKEIFLKVKYIKIHKSICTDNVITIDQYRKLMSSLKQDNQEQWYINILILAKTGTRISELLRLTKGDAKRGYADLYTKGKVRRIYFPASLTAELADYLKTLDKTDFLVRGIDKKTITSRGFSEALQRFAERYDIPAAVMHPHSFRHLFAIEFMKNNSNISLLADILGHSGVNTTMIYTRLSGDQQKREIDKAVNW